MSIRKDVRERIVAILSTANITSLTVATHVPEDIQHFELPLVYVVPSSSRRTQPNESQTLVTAQYRVVLIGAEVNVGLRAEIQDNLLDYVDEIYKVLNKAKQLQLTGSANITNVTRAYIDSDTGMVSPQSFPEGNPFSNYWAWSITFVVEYMLSSGGGYAC